MYILLKTIGVILLFSSYACSSQIEKGPQEKILIDIGDSLTAGAGGNGVNMSSITQNLLGDSWNVKNMGVGGENTLTIGARHGSIPMYLKESINIPKNGSPVKITGGLYSSYNDSMVRPLLQGDAGVNPCYIDSIKCKLTRVEDDYFIQRLDNGAVDHTTQPKTKIITALSRQKGNVLTIFIGQNGGYETAADLLDQIGLFVKHKGDNNVMIITSHGNGYPEIVGPIVDKYGNKVIDLRAYMSSQAIIDAVDSGLLQNNGTYPTHEDQKNMSLGNAPASLLIDGIHFNSIGYELLGRLRYAKGKELGYW